MEEDFSNSYKNSDPRKSSNTNSSFNKQSINKIQYKPILNNIFSDDFSEPKLFQKKTRFLLVKKLNLKEKNNKYYSKALKNIFSDVNKYLEHNYEGKKIIIGKKYTSKGLKELKDYFYRKNKKRRTLRRNDLKSSLSFFNKTIKNKSILGNKYLDITRNNSTDTIKAINSINIIRKDNIKKYPVPDSELKIIFQEGAEREKNNKNEKIEFSLVSTQTENNKIQYNKNKKIKNINKVKSAKNIIINTERMNINNMLNLQEKILKDNILNNKAYKKLQNKIMSATLKDNTKLLINNKKELIVLKKREIDKDINKFGLFNNENKDVKKWLSELRINNYKKNKKMFSPQKEIIYYNKDINSKLDINESHNGDFNKNILKISKKFFNNSNTNKNKFIKNNYKIKNVNIDNKNNSHNLNVFHNLYVQGKNLLNYKIKISKELFGKKKKIINYSYGADEISSILFAKSKTLNNINTPKAIINSIDIHNFG